MAEILSVSEKGGGFHKKWTRKGRLGGQMGPFTINRFSREWSPLRCYESNQRKKTGEDRGQIMERGKGGFPQPGG